MTLATPPSSIPGSILGNRVLRIEDPRLLTGSANYLADLPLDAPLHAVFVRSELAHGTISSIDVSDAEAMPGVVAVWTAQQLAVDPHHGFAKVHDDFARPPLATDRVRFVGEAVAVVFAESRQEGADAAAAVVVDIDPLPAHVDAEQALAEGAELIFPAHGSNLAVVESNDPPLDLEAISDVVVRGRYVNQRVAVAPMEPHGFAAEPAADGRLTVWPSNQFPHAVHGQLARTTGIPIERLHLR